MRPARALAVTTRRLSSLPEPLSLFRDSIPPPPPVEQFLRIGSRPSTDITRQNTRNISARYAPPDQSAEVVVSDGEGGIQVTVPGSRVEILAVSTRQDIGRYTRVQTCGQADKRARQQRNRTLGQEMINERQGHIFRSTHTTFGN